MAFMDAAVEETLVEAGGLRVGGLLSAVSRPRAVLLALHGGAVRPSYWDCPGHAELSLLRTASALGFTAVALERPGYGASYQRADHLDAGERAELTFAALAATLAGRPSGAGVFLVAHSAGCALAVRMAATARARERGLLGLELAGTGRRHPAAAAELLDARRLAEGGLPRPGGLRKLLWEPAELYPPEVRGGLAIGARSPGYEAEVVTSWASRDFAAYAGRVHVPVHYTIAEHERVWLAGPEGLADVAGLFTGSPRVVAEQQDGSGHNLSVGAYARAYHLRVLSFVEECVAGRSLRTPPPPPAAVRTRSRN
jgi:pimeloyl-ACP methyl ester carboxylesterase